MFTGRQGLFGLEFGPHTEGIGREARQLRLNTLVRLRWLAVAGQTVTIVGAVVMGFVFPVPLCLALVALSVSMNFGLRRRFRVSTRLTESGATVLLAFDAMQLAALLLLTGGVGNPFAILLLAPVAIGSTSLSLRNAVGLLGLTVVCVTALAAFSLPLPAIEGVNMPPIYAFARWAALAVSACFITLYAYQVAQEARLTAAALTATELALARVQHLSQLDVLATAAAHELGTPLATVSLVVREMAGNAPPKSEVADDLSLIEEQVARCREILGKLSSPTKMSGGSMDVSSPTELAEIAAGPHRLLGATITVTGDGPEPPPHCPRNPGVLFGLGNLIENAVTFAESAVTIRAVWTSSVVRIVISDDGEGFPDDILERIGEPYISRRDAARRNDEAGEGLGLGLFIARSLLARSRASLAFANAAPPEKGAVVTVEWSRAAYEGGRRPEF